jgi:hypothetical protein
MARYESHYAKAERASIEHEHPPSLRGYGEAGPPSPGSYGLGRQGGGEAGNSQARCLCHYRAGRRGGRQVREDGGLKVEDGKCENVENEGEDEVARNLFWRREIRLNQSK